MKILLFGPPGVGKGTQADLLSTKYNLVRFSTGDILREEVSKKSQLGNRIAHLLDSGQLVPDEIVSDLMEYFLAKNQHAHILFDGYPRTLVQAQKLEDSLQQMNTTLEFALEMYLNEDKIVRRIVNRRYCPKCGRIYNYITNPPGTDDLCDQCNVKVTKRSDDDEKVIRERLRVYIEETQPLVEYYKSKSVYSRIDATGSQDEVFKKITHVIDAHINKE